ncbi:MAG: amylo-alpha-1,6-glucosidase [Gemmatimonadales bacterium]
MTSAAVPGRRPTPPLDAEWLEPDGLGGFASGTVSGERRRRYHGLLTVATTPPTGRVMLLSGFDASVERARDQGDARREFLTPQRYRPGVQTESAELEDFTIDPWPTWTFRLAGGLGVIQEIMVPRGQPTVAIRWRLEEPAPGVRLVVRPFLVARDLHALERERELWADAEVSPGRVRFAPDERLPAIECLHDGSYRHDPTWYRGFELDEERDRGFDSVEDALAPGAFEWDLSSGGAAQVAFHAGAAPPRAGDLDRLLRDLRKAELTRRETPNRLERAIDAYLVERGGGRSIVAGYPWFTDWGRDTFIAMRGLCLGAGRLDDARSILLAWAATVSEGMLPNRFVDRGDTPEFNSVDASLWYVIAAHEYLAKAARIRRSDGEAIGRAVRAILDGYRRGTRYGIRMDGDGLLACGVPGQQLTWMDARIGDWVVTPRIGKPVEIQALWINALRLGAGDDPSCAELAAKAEASFVARFWNAEAGMLYDVADVAHVPGRVDSSVRPNQIFAVGGLPVGLLDRARAARVVEAVETRLLTPLGLRSLAPGDPDFAPRYQGGPRERDAAYHQGTVWPWLLGAFVEAWLRVAGDTVSHRAEARRRFLEPLLAHLDTAGLGHISEIADATPPFTPRGCPFQAWSLGEALRIEALTRPPASGRRAGRRASPARSRATR